MGSSKSSDNSKIEFIAKITGPDGKVVETTVSFDCYLPSAEEFDYDTKEGFLSDFNTLEKAVLKARNKLGENITSKYMDEVSKKTP